MGYSADFHRLGGRASGRVGVAAAAFVFGLSAVAIGANRASAAPVPKGTTVRAANATPVGHATGLGQALGADGTIRAHSGSYDAKGYRMMLDRQGTPHFVKADAPAPTTTASALSTAVTSADASWSDSFGPPGAPNAGVVDAVAVSGNDVYIGGSFATLSADALLPYNNVAVWDGHGWRSLGSGTANGTNGQVDAVAVMGNNVFFGGNFNSAGGQSAADIAEWNGTNWSALGSGMTDTTTSGTPIVKALKVVGTTLYAGGSFDDAGGVASPSLAAWNGTAWGAVGTGVLQCTFFDVPNHCYGTPNDGTVDSLAVSSTGSTLYVGGAFNFVGGQEYYGLAQWDGTAWSGIGGFGAINNGSVGPVFGMAVDAGTGTLYVGGTFDHIGITSTHTGGVAAASVAAWNGTAWSALGVGANNCSGCGNATVSTVAVRSGVVYVSGSFYGMGGDNARQIGQWNGAAWTAVGPGLDAPPSALAATVKLAMLS